MTGIQSVILFAAVGGFFSGVVAGLGAALTQMYPGTAWPLACVISFVVMAISTIVVVGNTR